MPLQQYIVQTQRLIRDTQGLFVDRNALVQYINEGRTQVALNTGCIQRLITGQPPFGASAMPADPANPSRSPSTPSGNAVKIECYGDSTILGLTYNGLVGGPTPGHDGTVASIVPEPAPAALQRMLQSVYGPVVVVTNFGVTGTTCADWLNGTNGVARPWLAQMQGSTADIVIICLGINDFPNELALNYPLLVSIAEAAGHKVVVQTPNQLNITFGDIGPRAQNEIVIQQAHPNSLLVDFYTYTVDLGLEWINNELSYSNLIFPPNSYWSGIHPNQTGYESMAGLEFEVLAPVVGSMIGDPANNIDPGNFFQSNPTAIPGGMMPGSNPLSTFSTMPNVERYSFVGFANQYLNAQHRGLRGIHDVMQVAVSWGSAFRPALTWMPWEEFQAQLRATQTLVTNYPYLWSVFNDGENGEVWMYPPPQSVNEMEWIAYATPADIYTDNDFDAVPHPFQRAVKYYAAARAYEDSQRFQNAALMYARFEQSIGVSRVAVDRGKVPSYYPVAS